MAKNPFTCGVTPHCHVTAGKSSPKTEKFILDATAGFRMMWFDKHHPNCIYLDRRPECEPDIVGDFRDLKQFPDETFRLIIFDPPHLVRSPNKPMLNMEAAFGALEIETWQKDLSQGFKELWRILQPFGILLFKWNNHSISSDKLLALAPDKPLIYQITQSRRREGAPSGDRVNQTLWFCFMKIPQSTEKLEHG